MENNKFRALARWHALEALKMLAAIAVDHSASPSDRKHARNTLELMLEEAGDDIPSDLIELADTFEFPTQAPGVANEAARVGTH